MPAMVMLHEEDPRERLLKDLGDLDQFEVFNNQVLCAVYIRPERTRSGIILADATRDEDKSQGKIALVVKLGPSAFNDPTGKWEFPDIKVGDWVYFRVSDGWNITVNAKSCRVVNDIDIRGRVQHPDQVW